MLEIIKEYKFKLGGSVCRFSEGDSLKVKTNDEIIQGTLTSVEPDGEYFRLDCGDESVKIYCNKVIDIMPI